MRDDHEDLLRRLALNDESALGAVVGPGLADDVAGLDPGRLALVRLAGVVALGAEPASYQWAVTAALAAGVPDRAVVGVLAALVPVAGTVRVRAAAAEVAVALGCEIEVPGD